MRARVAVVGASGRVGRAIAAHLSGQYEVVRIARHAPDEDVGGLAKRAVAGGADVLINAAGVAHVEHASEDDLRRLELGNVEVPAALAAAALDRRISMIHISSVKAADPSPTSPYASSKRRGDERLQTEFAERFATAGLALIIVRPLALLIPPLDAGRVSHLSFLRWWPRALTPPIRLPVLAPARFLAAIDDLVEGVLAGQEAVGVSVRSFDRRDRGSLRDVQGVFIGPGEEVEIR
jgi:nucleoside-diphosphate-sugar epimerase